MTAPSPYADAYAIIQDQLAKWGLTTLGPDVTKFLQQGDNADTIQLKLQDTPAYKQRFAGNAQRSAKGLSVLSPAEYISVEEQYKQSMREAGLPAGFYDSNDDLTKFIANDVSPNELTSRVQLASQQYQLAAPEQKQAWQDYYGLTPGHAVAAILDPDVALPILQRQADTVSIAAARRQQFGQDDPTTPADQKAQDELLAQRGVTALQARQGFGTVAARQSDDEFLASLSGRQGPTVADQTAEELLNDQKAAQVRKRTLDEETAAFKSGYSGQQGGFSANTQGSY